MNRRMWQATGTAAAMLTVSLWACKAPPVPDADRSQLWDQVHGKQAPVAKPAVAEPTQPVGEWNGEVVFSETEKDLGDVQRGEEAKHLFTITNKTDRVLHIKNVRGS